jgi:hypothetical protein
MQDYKIDTIKNAGIDLDQDLILMHNGEEVLASYQDKVDYFFDILTSPSSTYKYKRAGFYPDMREQLDAILKYIDKKGDADGDMADIILKWKRVKSLYPKNTGA